MRISRPSASRPANSSSLTLVPTTATGRPVCTSSAEMKRPLATSRPLLVA